MGHPEHKCKKALTWRGFSAHTQKYLLTTGISAQVLLWKSISGQRHRDFGVSCTPLPVLDASEAEGSPHSHLTASQI